MVLIPYCPCTRADFMRLLQYHVCQSHHFLCFYPDANSRRINEWSGHDVRHPYCGGALLLSPLEEDQFQKVCFGPLNYTINPCNAYPVKHKFGHRQVDSICYKPGCPYSVSSGTSWVSSVTDFARSVCAVGWLITVGFFVPGGVTTPR